MRMAAGISFHVKWSHDCIIVTDIAHFPPILTPCTLLTTILLLIDVIKVIDATIFSACLVPRKLRASGAKPQRRRPENFGIELQCDLLQRKKRTRALAYALVRAAERRTPCEQQTDSKRHVRVLFAAGDTPHEVISLLLSTSNAPSEFRSSAQRQQLRRPCDSFWFLFAFFTGPAPQALNFQGRAPRAEEARVLYWNWPARLLPAWVPLGTRPAPQGRGSKRGPGSKYGGFVTGLLLRDLVERSILVYGKWGQFGHLGGARRGMSFA